MAMVKKHHAWKVNEPDVWLYGEDLYGVHSIEYEPVAEHETFYAFALRHGDGAFASFAKVEAYAKHAGRFRSCRCCSGGAFARLPGSGRSWSRPTVKRPCSGGSGRASSCGWREGLRRRSSRTTSARASVPDTCRATSTGPGIGDHAGSRRGPGDAARRVPVVDRLRPEQDRAPSGIGQCAGDALGVSLPQSTGADSHAADTADTIESVPNPLGQRAESLRLPARAPGCRHRDRGFGARSTSTRHMRQFAATVSLWWLQKRGDGDGVRTRHLDDHLALAPPAGATVDLDTKGVVAGGVVGHHRFPGRSFTALPTRSERCNAWIAVTHSTVCRGTGHAGLHRRR